MLKIHDCDKENIAYRNKSIMHGLRNHKLYSVWNNEKQRCTNKNNSRFENYGNRGIKVSKEFHNFKVWLEYVESLSNAYKDGYSIDRIDNDKGYERGNLRWSSKLIQAQNKTRLTSRNTSGFRGISFDKASGKWRSRICINNKTKYIGRYDTPINAAVAYDKYIVDNNLEHTRNEILSMDFI